MLVAEYVDIDRARRIVVAAGSSLNVPSPQWASSSSAGIGYLHKGTRDGIARLISKRRASRLRPGVSQKTVGQPWKSATPTSLLNYAPNHNHGRRKDQARKMASFVESHVGTRHDL